MNQLHAWASMKIHWNNIYTYQFELAILLWLLESIQNYYCWGIVALFCAFSEKMRMYVYQAVNEALIKMITSVISCDWLIRFLTSSRRNAPNRDSSIITEIDQNDRQQHHHNGMEHRRAIEQLKWHQCVKAATCIILTQRGNSVRGKAEDLHTLLGAGTWHKLDGFLSTHNKNIKTILPDERYVVLRWKHNNAYSAISNVLYSMLRKSRIEYVWTAVLTK